MLWVISWKKGLTLFRKIYRLSTGMYGFLKGLNKNLIKNILLTANEILETKDGHRSYTKNLFGETSI